MMSAEESVDLDTSSSRPRDERRGRARPTLGYLAVVLGVGLLCPSTACSLKNFDYLKEGSSAAGDSSLGGQDTGGGGNANVAGESSGGSSGSESSAGGTTTARGGSTGSSVGGTSATTTTAGPTGKLINPSFENGSTGWTADPAGELGWPNDPKYSAFVQPPVGSATVHEGAVQLSFYNSERAFQVKVSQTIEGIADGQYTFSGWFTLGTLKSTYIYAKGCGGTDPPQVPITLSDIWHQVSIPTIDVVGGKCEVGFYVDGAAFSWLNADDFAFEPVVTTAATGG